MQLEAGRRTSRLHDLTGMTLVERNNTEYSDTITQDKPVFEPTDRIVSNDIVFTVQSLDSTQVNYRIGDKLRGSTLMW